MRGSFRILGLLVMLLLVASATTTFAQVTFKDPTGDDNGPGTYTYPTDAVYTPGSFDLTGLTVDVKGKKVDFTASVKARLEDPWRMGVGFSVQMLFIFIDTGNEANPHFTQGLPGLNITFAKPGWDRVVILSPQTSARVNAEVDSKVPDNMKKAVIVPVRTKGVGHDISASVKLEDLGGGDPAKWGYQVVMQSNEGFPAGNDLLTRKVNEFEGQHRFGGGTDYDCDPHVMDILAGKGEGVPAEIEEQHKMLQYECGPEGKAIKLAELKMVRK